MNTLSIRTRPARSVNCFRLTLERGDYECIDLGEMPDLSDPIAISRFLVRLGDARDRAGDYDAFDSWEWRPKLLDFQIMDSVA